MNSSVPSSNPNDANLNIIYALFGVVLLAFVAILLFIVFKFKRRNNKADGGSTTRNSSNDDVGFEDGGSHFGHPRHTHRRYERKLGLHIHGKGIGSTWYVVRLWLGISFNKLAFVPDSLTMQENLFLFK